MKTETQKLFSQVGQALVKFIVASALLAVTAGVVTVVVKVICRIVTTAWGLV